MSDRYHLFIYLCVLFRAAPTACGVPRLGVQSELQLPAYTTATATPDLGRVFNLHHSSRQSRILNPLSQTRDRTRNLMVPSRIRFRCATTGTLISFHSAEPQALSQVGAGVMMLIFSDVRDFSQLKLELCPPLPLFCVEFASAQAPS